MPGHRHFARYVMSDVYALLDYLSGRASPSLGPAGPGRPRRREEPDVDSIEHDLADQNGMLCRTMRIGETLDSEPGEISFADAAFLISARDLLNLRAAPATGSSIPSPSGLSGDYLARQGRGRRRARTILSPTERWMMRRRRWRDSLPTRFSC